MRLRPWHLVDRQGNVIWFDVWGGASVDLRKPEDVRASVDKMLGELPGALGAAAPRSPAPGQAAAPAAAPPASPAPAKPPAAGLKVTR